jgi:hypothetical protein
MHGKDQSGREDQYLVQAQYSITTKQWTVSIGGQTAYVFQLPHNLQQSFWAQMVGGQNVNTGVIQTAFSVGTQFTWQPKDYFAIGAQAGGGPTIPTSGPSSIDLGASIFIQIMK